MATSKTAICNMALAKLGDKPRRISDYTLDEGVNAQWCRDFYDLARNEVIARCDFACVRKTAELTQSAEDPDVTAWTYKYERPDDCVVFRKMTDEGGNEYEFYEMTDSDGRFLYANVDDAWGVYSFLNDDPTTYSPGLIEMIYWSLAEKLALPVTGKASIQQAMFMGLDRADRVGRAKDGVEHYIEQPEGNTKWTDGY